MVLNESTKKIGILLLALAVIFLGFISVASASSLFTAEYDIINARITPFDVAEYNLTITNYELSDKVYTLGMISQDAGGWIPFPVSVMVPADSSKSFTFKLYPKSNVGLGTYQLRIRIRTSDETVEMLSLPVSVSLDAFYTGYQPDVAMNVVTPEKQDPREKMKMVVLLRNRNQLDISELSVVVTGDLFFKEFNLSLGPLKETSRDLLFDFNPLQSPGTYKYNVKLLYPKTGGIVAEADKTFDIEGYSKVSTKSEKESKWFMSKETIYLLNEGNFERTKEVSIASSWVSRIFIKTEPRAEVGNVDGKSSLMWSPSIKPTEEKQIVIYKNYRPLVIIIIILILIIIGYFIFRSPMIVLKEGIVVGEDAEGVSSIKVRVFVKNRSGRTLHNISINDRLPRICDLAESDHMGAFKPTRITKNTVKGTLLYWDIDRLDSFEERILTYRINSKLKIVGDLSMPRVRVKFETASGAEKTIISNVPLFLRKY